MATTIYTISNTSEDNVNGNSITSSAKYVPGSSIFYISYDDLGTDIKSVSGVSSSNASIISEVTTDNTVRKITIKTGTYVALKAPGNSLVSTNFEVNLKYTVTFNDNTTNVMYSKVSFYVEANGNIYSCVMTSLNGTLDPTSYVNYKLAHADSGKDDLDSLVTKKGLVVNMKEMARQISNKIGATAALSINYKLNGGHWDDGFEPRSTFVVSTGYTPKPPKRVGYKFDGWRVFPATGNDSIDDSTTAGSLYDNGPSEVAIKVGTAEDITACAKWAPVVYQVKFKNADGNYGSSPFITYGTGTTSANLAANAHATSTITGDSATAASAFTSPTGITAGYEFANKYTVLGSNGQEVIYNVGTSLDKIYDLVKSDNEVNGTTIELTPVTSPKVFNLTYNLNESASTTADNLPNTASLDSGTVNKYTYDTTFNLPIPVAKGYSFDGWNIGGTSLQNQRVINPTDLATVNSGSVTLTATWVKNSYHFEFDVQGGTLDSTDLVYISPDATYTIWDPSKEGYTFSGWTGDDTKVTIGTHNDITKTTLITVKNNIDTDIILKATWSPAVVKVNVEYWYEDINSSRTTAASTTNTTYNLSAVKALDLGNSASVKTGDNLTVSTSGSNVVITSKHNNNTDVGTMTIIPEDGFDYVANTVSDNAVIRADGTTVIRLYFARKTVYYMVYDIYNKDTITNSGSEGAKVKYPRTTSNQRCLYGQTQIFAANFGDDNPEAGYTVDVPSKKALITATSSTSPNEITFTYSRKKFTVKFDLNNCCKFTTAGSVGNAYSTTRLYNQKVTFPTVANTLGVTNSVWSKNGTTVNATTTEEAVTCDTIYIRVPTYTNYTVIVNSNTSSYNYDNSSYSAAHTISSALHITDFPYFLKTVSSSGYTFTEWQFKNKAGEYVPFAGNSISTTILNEINDSTIDLKAIFSVAEPTIKSIPADAITYNPNTLIIDGTNGSSNAIQLENGATDLYLAKVTSDKGIGKLMSKSGNNYASATTLAADDVILLTPAKTDSSTGNVITGKPWVGTISSVASSTISITWRSSYAISNTDTNTIYGISDGIMDEAERRKLALIAEGATATAVAQGEITDTTTLSGNSVKKETVNKYEVGTIKVNNTLTTLYGKDTTYGVATDEKLGLVKLSSSTKLKGVQTPADYNKDKAYPVQITEGGVMGVVVPWQDNQTLPVTTLVTSDTNTGTTNATANGTVCVNPVETKGTAVAAKSGIGITGSGGTSVRSNTSGLITIYSPSQAPTLVRVSGKTGTVSKSSSILTLNVEGESYKIRYDGDLANKSISNAYTIDGNYAVSFDIGSLSGETYLATNVSIDTRNPALVKAAASTEASKFLKGDGSWDTPPNTQVKYGSKVITSIVAGDNITTSLNGAVLTIAGTPNTTYTHAFYPGSTNNKMGITVNQPVSPATQGTIQLNEATNTTIGGIKVGLIGTSNITSNTNPNSSMGTTGITISGSSNQVVYKPANTGYYYPVEITSGDTSSGYAVVKIPNVTTPTAGTGTVGGFKAAESVSPGTINHITTGSYYSVDIVSTGTNKDQAVVCVPTSSGGSGVNLPDNGSAGQILSLKNDRGDLEWVDKPASGTTVKCIGGEVSEIAVGSGISASYNGGTLTLKRDDIWDTSSSGEKRPTITGTNNSGTISVSITKPSSANLMVVEYNKNNSYGTTIFVTKSGSTELAGLDLTTATGSIAYLKITIADSDRTYKPFIVSLEWDSSLEVVPSWYN